ncbi:MAG: hypothetical protein HKN27_05520, partial [Silicimonas sp.]|nr:hypothetical protein [Silicimonas sp.]
MRLLIVNPNTSHGVTDKIQSAANEVAMGKDRFTTRSAAFGPKLIVTQADAERAAKGVVETVKSHSQPCDGVILASFGDTGAREVRQLRPDIPVIGIASAAFSVVRSLAGPFGIVTFGENLVPGLRNKAIEAGLSENLMLISAVKSHEIGDPGTVQMRFK